MTTRKQLKKVIKNIWGSGKKSQRVVYCRKQLLGQVSFLPKREFLEVIEILKFIFCGKNLKRLF